MKYLLILLLILPLLTFGSEKSKQKQSADTAYVWTKKADIEKILRDGLQQVDDQLRRLSEERFKLQGRWEMLNYLLVNETDSIRVKK